MLLCVDFFPFGIEFLLTVYGKPLALSQMQDSEPLTAAAIPFLPLLPTVVSDELLESTPISGLTFFLDDETVVSFAVSFSCDFFLIALKML